MRKKNDTRSECGECENGKWAAGLVQSAKTNWIWVNDEWSALSACTWDIILTVRRCPGASIKSAFIHSQMPPSMPRVAFTSEKFCMIGRYHRRFSASYYWVDNDDGRTTKRATEIERERKIICEHFKWRGVCNYMARRHWKFAGTFLSRNLWTKRRFVSFSSFLSFYSFLFFHYSKLRASRQQRRILSNESSWIFLADIVSLVETCACLSYFSLTFLFIFINSSFFLLFRANSTPINKVYLPIATYNIMCFFVDSLHRYKRCNGEDSYFIEF